MSEIPKDLPITIIPKETIKDKEEWLRNWINLRKGGLQHSKQDIDDLEWFEDHIRRVRNFNRFVNALIKTADINYD